LLPVQAGRATGGATVRIWTDVTNPNPFGFTLSTVQARLLLDDIEAADAEFPLGLPLEPRQTETIPFDLTVSFANVPRLANVIRQAASGGGVTYRLEGTVGVDAGRFGQPTFGPLTLLTGDLRARF
jgi:LEA14-like dessication related protein